ncbi:hypothetical protein [Actinomadura mexicana]|uniref:Uncharacterized protein n=1 Tax=Actinomadura mexicana TaxID=134959 RepID=A0A238UMG0_9ACTN|nr:hypothetical protein [Actinomadura mexicana]SNR23218.1 hypothetical protein SAMN06265355_101119 [Actinomadura mexicana]
MSTAMVPVTPEWALWGKDPQERDFRLLRCSDIRLGAHDFSEIISRYSPGTHTDLPQVAISWTRLGEEIYLGFAIQEWSNEDDRLGRGIAVTRYFGIPYYRLERPISYVDLYEALADRDATDGAPISVPELDPHQIADRVGLEALGAAALLLTRSPVQLEGAEGVPMVERLGFLDTVAALLPYAMRTRLSAATWVSSTSEHNFRLAFSSHAREGALTVRWGDPPVLPPAARTARTYFDVLARQSDLSHVIRELARIGKPMGFDRGHVRAALGRLQDIAGSPAQRPAPAVSTDADPVEVLRAYAEARREGRGDAAEHCIDRLEHLRTRIYTAEQRSRHRQIVRADRLLDASDTLEPPRQLQLYQALLQMAYGSTLSESHLEQIEEDAGMIHGLLLRTLENYPGADAYSDLLVAVMCGDEGRRRILGRLDSETLIATAVQEPVKVVIFDMVFNELVRRLVEEDDPAVGPLWQHAYLAHPLRRRFPGDDLAQFDWLCRLLAAAYGPQLGVKEFEEVVDGSRTPRPTTALFAAALWLYGIAPDTREMLFEAFFGRMLESATLGPEVAEGVNAVLQGTVAAEQARGGPPRRLPRGMGRLVQRLHLGRDAPEVPERQEAAPPAGAPAPESFGQAPGADEQAGRSPQQDFETRFGGQGPWLVTVVLVVFLVALTLVLLSAQWLRVHAPPP